jgi:predicted GTPase
VLNILQEGGIQSKLLDIHMAKAKELCSFPETDRVRIAILGSAGVGKSSLLNAVTSIPGLAKSVFPISSLTTVLWLMCF